MSAASPVRLITLGGVRCTTESGEVHAVTSQPRRVALLVYLALAQPRGFHSRDRLLALFWPDYDEQRARNALSQALHFLRRSLGADALVSGAEDQLRLDTELVSCDVIEFEAALAAGRTAEGVDLYHGPFLEGFHISAAAAELDGWVDGERQRLGRLYAGALQRLAEDREAAGDFAGAVEWHRRLAAHDPLSSRIALGLIRALAAAGETESALQHARVHEMLSRAELDASPDPAITAFVNELRQRIAAPTPNADRHVGAPSAVSGPEDFPKEVDLLPRSTASSRSVTNGRRKRQAMIAIGWVVAVSLAFVPMANPKHSEATPRIECVAVLPIENLSGDSTIGHFTEAMTVAAITELGRYQPLHVIPHTSVKSLKGTTKTLPDIGRVLNCDAIVEASLTRTSNVAHVDAQLSYAPDTRILWTESYETDTSQIVWLERQVISGLVRHVRALAGQTNGMAAPKRRVDPLVYSAYSRGRNEFRGWNALSVKLAVGFYQQAIALDSTFAPAYAALADAYNLIGWEGYGAPEYLDSARTLAEYALALDSASSEAHTTKAFILTSDAEWTRAEAEFKKAIELDDKNALAHHWYAVLLAILNRKDEALNEIRRAHDLDPESQEIDGKRIVLQLLTGVKASLGNPGRLRGWPDPNNPGAWAGRAITLARKGQCADAYRASERWQELTPDNTIALVGLILVDQACKQSSRANALLAEVKRRRDAPLMAVYIAMPYVVAQQPDSAFAWLARSHWGIQTYWALRTSNLLDPLRSDPRFPELLRRLHLP
jgi:DNA-binding SARP family transcriptional activator/TolB-like protein